MGDEVIDNATLRDLVVTTDAAFTVELIETYLEDTPHLLASIRTGLEDDDREGIRRAAHSLKSSSATLGASSLASLAKNLEVMARDGPLEGGAAALAEIELMFEQVQKELERVRDDIED